MPKPSTDSFRLMFRESLLRVTADAVKAWWSGRSTKVAARQGSAIAILWVARIYPDLVSALRYSPELFFSFTVPDNKSDINLRSSADEIDRLDCEGRSKPDAGSLQPFTDSARSPRIWTNE